MFIKVSGSVVCNFDKMYSTIAVIYELVWRKNYVDFSNSLIIHELMTQSACINSVRCMYVDTQ